MKFDLGDLLRDSITGFVGTVVGRTDYLTACNVYLLVPKSDDPSKRPDGEWFDEERLELVKEKHIILGRTGLKPGADIMAPKR